MAESKSISIEEESKCELKLKLNASELAEIQGVHEHIQKIGRVRRIDDGKGDFCLRVDKDTSPSHRNPVYKSRQNKYGLTKFINNKQVAYTLAHHQFRSKFDKRMWQSKDCQKQE